VQNGTELAGRARAAMEEIVRGTREVTDIIGQISEASDQQSRGIEAINVAVAQMDRATQQNAALVEEAASAAASLEEEAHRLDETVATFKLAGPPHPTLGTRDPFHSPPGTPARLDLIRA
jgi:methyl-accepting chemotaxis protein